MLLSILVINIYFVAWDDRQRRAELGGKARRVLARLDSKCHLFSRSSESVGSVQVNRVTVFSGLQVAPKYKPHPPIFAQNLGKIHR